MTTLPSGAFDEAARLLREHGSFIFLKSGARYLDPGVPDQWSRLAGEGARQDADTWSAVEEILLARLGELEPRVYFPVPMARNRELDDAALLDRFSYRMIVVDDEQRWIWNGAEVAERTRLFFTEHLSYESVLDRYYFEYAVNENWIDKCYLEALTTPIVARALEVRDGRVAADLNNGERDLLDPETFHIDSRERLLARSEGHGEVLIDGNERFRLLRAVSEDLTATELDGLRIELSYEQAP